jgi:hypothetical protein
LIKSHVKTSTFDLFDSWQAIKHAITNQLRELNHMRVSQQIRTPLDVSGVMFEAVRGWVSHQALRKVQEQRQLLLAPLKAPCSHSFTSSHGLPCVHTLKKLEEEKKSLLLEHFHPHWHLKRDAAPPRPILEPRPVPKRAVHILKQPASSTRREPSGFEIVQAVKKAPSTCSRCHRVGHIMTSNTCPLKYSELLPGPSFSQNATSNASTDPAVEKTSLPAQLQAQSMAPEESSPSEPALPPKAPEPAGHISLRSTSPTAPKPLQHTSPEAIYARYVAARSAWYAAQPAGCAQTNQAYRKAMKLPPKYSTASFKWCLDYKCMGRVCRSRGTIRPWTAEEVMAYLDWSNAEDARVEEEVRMDIEANSFRTTARGPGYLWEHVDRDIEEQNRIQGIDETS